MRETPGNAAPDPVRDEPGGDPWAAFGYLVAGVVFYGVIGWVLSLWLDATYWIPIGILVGAGFGMYMVFARYRIKEPEAGFGPPPGLDRVSRTDDSPSTTSASEPDDSGRTTRPTGDDRGETA